MSKHIFLTALFFGFASIVAFGFGQGQCHPEHPNCQGGPAGELFFIYDEWEVPCIHFCYNGNEVEGVRINCTLSIFENCNYNAHCVAEYDTCTAIEL